MEDEKLEARVCGDYNEKMLKAIKLLRENGFRVSSTPCSGILEVQLYYGSDVYDGLDEITKFVNSFKDKYKNEYKT